MSYIAFNAAGREPVLLRGPERYLMGRIVSDLMSIATKSLQPETVIAHGDPHHYIAMQAQRVIDATDTMRFTELKRFEEQVATYIRVGEMGGSDALFFDTDLFTMSLNTAMMLGSPLVRLLARIHGQCEIHLWFEEPDAPAIADIMAAGLAARVLREEMGWSAVIDLLRTPGVGEIVLSYSVTESFPDSYLAIDDRLPPAQDFTGYEKMPQDEKDRLNDAQEKRDAVWEEFTAAECWAASMRGLREKGSGLQLVAADLQHSFHFGDGRTGFDLGKARS